MVQDQCLSAPEHSAGHGRVDAGPDGQHVGNGVDDDVDVGTETEENTTEKRNHSP